MLIILLIVIMFIIGISILYVYNQLFKKNIQKVLANEIAIKLPDLNDVIISYIILCTIIMFSLGIISSKNKFRTTINTCVEDDVIIKEITYDYGFCINDYGNLIFKDSEKALSEVNNQYSELIDSMIDSSVSVASNNFDNIYWKLYNSRSTIEKEELFLLYSIYLNAYETKYIDIKYERVK